MKPICYIGTILPLGEHMKKITHQRSSFSLKASVIGPEPGDTLFEFAVYSRGVYCATYQLTKAQIYQCLPLIQAMQTWSYTEGGEYHWTWGNIPQEVEKFRVHDPAKSLITAYRPHQCPTCGEECECDLVIDDSTGVEGVHRGWTLPECTHEANYKAFLLQVWVDDLEEELLGGEENTVD